MSIAHQSISMIGRDGRLHSAAPRVQVAQQHRTTVGYPLPAPQDCRYRAQENDWGDTANVECRYITRGPVFRSGAMQIRLHLLLASERKNIEFDLIRTAYADVLAQVRAHNAIVDPIPNN